MRQLYSALGMTIASEVPLPGQPLSSTDGSEGIFCEFELVEGRVPPDEARWLHHVPLPDGKPWLSLGKSPGGYMLRFENCADFWIYPGRHRICCLPAVSLSPQWLSHLLCDQVLPYALNLFGKEVLHASAVELGGYVAGFLGFSGAGKSTLATSLFQAGDLHVADDGLCLEPAEGHVRVVVGPSKARLWPTSAVALGLSPPLDSPRSSPKLEILLERSCPAPRLPLSLLYVLERHGDPSVPVRIEPLTFRERVASLIRHSYRFDIQDQEMLARQFRFFETIAREMPVNKLLYYPDLSALPGIRAFLWQHIESLFSIGE